MIDQLNFEWSTADFSLRLGDHISENGSTFDSVTLESGCRALQQRNHKPLAAGRGNLSYRKIIIQTIACRKSEIARQTDCLNHKMLHCVLKSN
ncbi:hypothetical protein OYT88_20340 [Sporolactobacillus sp. CQH2019]|uniref:hypothetical protein n=1 Tax=Sporolactobacillus sp. CQH2019 TaxID=3023512 RepID=UPI0023684935|nr:hypothetical protein [Sporolactobacillus sp. CQH2019]MDD9150872.1 hypothetical protein [Sporolactobacillus sp. CQH2019]